MSAVLYPKIAKPGGVNLNTPDAAKTAPRNFWRQAGPGRFSA
jgi:hypothetical protein